MLCVDTSQSPVQKCVAVPRCAQNIMPKLSLVAQNGTDKHYISPAQSVESSYLLICIGGERSEPPIRYQYHYQYQMTISSDGQFQQLPAPQNVKVLNRSYKYCKCDLYSVFHSIHFVSHLQIASIFRLTKNTYNNRIVTLQ